MQCGTLKVQFIPDDLRRFFSLQEKTACPDCVERYKEQKAKLWGPPVRLEQEAA